MPLTKVNQNAIPLVLIVNADGTAIDSDLPNADALNPANPDALLIRALSYLFNGATWDRLRGDTANGLDVDVTRLPALVAGAAVIGKVRLVDANGDEITVDSINSLSVAMSATGADDGDAVSTASAKPVSSGNSKLFTPVWTYGLAPDSAWDRLRTADDSGNGLGALRTVPTANTKYGASFAKLRDLAATVTAIKAGAGNLYGLQILNNQGAAAYVQVFNVAAGSVVLGTTTPDMEFLVGANAQVNVPLPSVGIEFGTAISAASTTAEGGAVGSAAGVMVFAQYE